MGGGVLSRAHHHQTPNTQTHRTLSHSISTGHERTQKTPQLLSVLCVCVCFRLNLYEDVRTHT
jgi:hypothetical protein